NSRVLALLGISLALVDISLAQRFRRLRGGDVRNRAPLGTEENYGPPEPFEFTYASQDEEGSHTHNQQGSNNGRITGEYEIQLTDGRSRVVKYYADDSGFYADVATNELGTEGKNPADVIIRSSAPTGPEAALSAEPTRGSRSRGSGAPRFSRVFQRQRG
ncbi:cuticular protein-like, partial [Tropilaelaps mercedesae]